MSLDDNVSCGAWNQMGDRFYRKFEVYQMSWGADMDVSKYILAGAPHGGPIGDLSFPSISSLPLSHESAPGEKISQR